MICFGKSTFLQHIIAYSTKNFKLLLSGESICSIAFFHHVEHLCFVSDHSESGDSRLQSAGYFESPKTASRYGGSFSNSCPSDSELYQKSSQSLGEFVTSSMLLMAIV